MSMFATFDDVADAFEGDIPETDRRRVETLIRRASARLLAIVPSTELRVQAGELDADLPAGLVVDAVLRVYRNPEGVTQEQIGPFSKQFNVRNMTSEVTFDMAEVHLMLDPLYSPAKTIRVGLPTVSQVSAEVSGYVPDPTTP